MYFLLLCVQDKPKHWQRTWQLKNWIKIVHLILNLYQELKYQKNCSKMCACGASQGQVKSSVQIWRSKGVNVLSQQVNEMLNRQAAPCPLDGCVLRLPEVVLGEGSGTRVRVLWLLQETAEFLAPVPAKVGAHWINSLCHCDLVCAAAVAAAMSLQNVLQHRGLAAVMLSSD